MHDKQYQECIVACQECATTCSQCAMDCLNENNVQHLTKCIQMNLECAAICRSAAEMMSLGSSYSEQLCRLCADVCNGCADECEKHSQMEHCKECAEECRNCADVCEKMSMVQVH